MGERGEKVRSASPLPVALACLIKDSSQLVIQSQMFPEEADSDLRLQGFVGTLESVQR